MREVLAPATQANLPETLRLYLPDPTEAAESYRQRLRSYRDNELRVEFENIIQRTMRMLTEYQRPLAVRLSLHDAIRRALLHSYAIRVEAYNPAIQATRVVQAEARFDATFFFNFQQNNTDHPNVPSNNAGLASLLSQLSNGGTGSTGTSGLLGSLLTASQPQATGTEVKTSTFQGGFSKLLATGAQVRTGYEADRQKTSAAATTFNPVYTDDVFFEITQPFLRNFGLDVTKSEIRLRKLDQDMAQQRYLLQVQQTIQQVEQAYWNLVQARRTLPITAELVAQTEQVLRYFEIRLPFDVQPVQLNDTRAQLATRQAQLIAALNQIRDSEAQLKALINDPSLPIPDEAAVIPTDIPVIDAVVLNRLVEIKTAVDNRPDIAQAKYAIQSARTSVTVANNQRLPRLDATFRYTSNGLGSNPDAAFEQLTTNDFVDYLVGVQFEWPIGNRAAEAAYRQARLQESQTIASLKQIIEQVILNVDLAFNNLDTLYRQMLPSATAVVAQVEDLKAIEQRADRRDPTFLNLELTTQQGLFSSRQSLLQTWVQYSIGIVNLELAKGTLLAYDNVRLEPRRDDP